MVTRVARATFCLLGLATPASTAGTIVHLNGRDS